jgi:hypothetical protein
MLPNLNSHTRHLSTFHSLLIVLCLHLHINLHTCRLAHYARSVKIFAAGLPYLRLTFSILLFYVRCGYLVVSMFASLGDSFTIWAYDFRLHLSPTAQFGILQFGLYRRNDFTLSRLPMLQFPPAIAFSACHVAVQTRATTCDFDLQFALQVYRLFSPSILRFPHQRRYRLHCTSISACDNS